MGKKMHKKVQRIFKKQHRLTVTLIVLIMTTWAFLTRVEHFHKKQRVATNAMNMNRDDQCKYKWKIPELSNLENYENNNEVKSFDTTNKKTLQWLYSNPKYKLDPTKFITTLLQRGPNNQVIELRNVITMAILLNRTLVVPIFRPHRTNGETESTVSPLHRVDVARMCRLVPCVHMDEYRDHCDGKIDVLFRQPNLKGVTERAMKKFEEWHGFEASKDAEYLPYDETKLIYGFIRTPREAQAIYSSDKKCGLVPFYYKLFIASDISDLFDEVIEATGLPPYIHEIAEDFIRSKIGNKKFIAIHWRYNKDDFQKRCDPARNKNLDDAWEDLCEKLDNLDENYISEALLKFGEERSENLKTKIFYVATPPSEIPRILKVAKILKKKGYTVLSHSDLDYYLQGTQLVSETCPSIQDVYFDMQSNAEMAICARSVDFVRAKLSSWSQNVIRMRKFSGIDSADIDSTTVFQMLGWKDLD